MDVVELYAINLHLTIKKDDISNLNDEVDYFISYIHYFNFLRMDV